METTRLISSTETCNRRHHPLEAHGCVRQEYVLCLMCHNPDTADPVTGYTVNVESMIHMRAQRYTAASITLKIQY